MQFIFVAMLAYPSQASSHGPFFLRKTAIPWQALLKSAAMFYLVNMLNNWAFAFNISVPVHIILRSFGSVTTMAAGWLNGKTYSQVQTLSVVMLTVGVLVSAWADAESKVYNLSMLLISGLTIHRENRWTPRLTSLTLHLSSVSWYCL